MARYGVHDVCSTGLFSDGQRSDKVGKLTQKCAFYPQLSDGSLATHIYGQQSDFFFLDGSIFRHGCFCFVCLLRVISVAKLLPPPTVIHLIRAIPALQKIADLLAQVLYIA